MSSPPKNAPPSEGPQLSCFFYKDKKHNTHEDDGALSPPHTPKAQMVCWHSGPKLECDKGSSAAFHH